MTSGIYAFRQAAAKMLGAGGGLLVIYRRLLRFSGTVLWLFLLVATRAFPGNRDHVSHGYNQTIWYICWLAFGVCFLYTTSSRERSPRVTFFVCGVETCIALYFAWLQPDSSINFLLVFVAWQMALLFPARIAIGWIILQSVAHIAVNKLVNNSQVMDLVQYVVYYGFKTFTCIIVILARGEAEARAEQAMINAQLQATRELLAENTRSLERLRISRELHDAVGHRLTALFLHLEVARNGQTSQQVQQHVCKAQKVSQDLLADVRSVVQTLRATSGVDLRKSLAALADDLPGLRVHLTAPDALHLEDAAQAEVLIRCVQEIITNTLKHAGASELWIDVYLEGAAVCVRAHDDGRSLSPARTEGLGITGMRERFLHYGGIVNVHGEDASGFSVTAMLPLAGIPVQP